VQRILLAICSVSVDFFFSGAAAPGAERLTQENRPAPLKTRRSDSDSEQHCMIAVLATFGRFQVSKVLILRTTSRTERAD
jgi:hypothetical protein